MRWRSFFSGTSVQIKEDEKKVKNDPFTTSIRKMSPSLHKLNTWHNRSRHASQALLLQANYNSFTLLFRCHLLDNNATKDRNREKKEKNRKRGFESMEMACILSFHCYTKDEDDFFQMKNLLQQLLRFSRK